MREILFRGKRKDNGEWVEGYYVCVGGKYHYILTGQIDLMSGYPRFIYCEVIPETVGQYTGLTDKNGKKIFEGDIVRFRTQTSVFKPSFLVMWHEETARFIVAIKDGVRAYPMDKTWKYEIIGNIHDNPELLKGD
ncbi:MAG: hypothetical protein IKL00_08810 [Oscillospiraceae bacterium]|nr:hypothetical protein [Oscillospiraceae bacterium]